MVNTPVVATLAAVLPLILPNRALHKVAALAGPPAIPPVTELDKRMNVSPPPVVTSSAPNIMNMTITVEEVRIKLP
ncbi:hypothetical protein HSBAA_46190 [Vreelandella sulfidaeris]|uniref:Uncharacterized protein n=1 Tax=Vreelandella sulfidaeris TaxID=115553 RepID=A0A455UDD3_9GAMM|nr:hypothetical protein HSBAA_46190 [Halomonas sulfidaeris]